VKDSKNSSTIRFVFGVTGMVIFGVLLAIVLISWLIFSFLMAFFCR